VSIAAAGLFAWIQSAQGYRRVHCDAVQLLSPGQGRIWLDVGCGPGLVTRLAAGHGYQAHGLDRDPAMIRIARAKGQRDNGCTFAVGDAGADLPVADVVSAASVLCQAPDPAELLNNLWAAVRPGGSLLLVETTQLMSVERIRRVSERDDRRSRQVLGLWARTRQGRALPDDVYQNAPAASRRLVPLLDGCVRAVILTRNA
jgi:SAM-dependent methyltransferase